MKMPKGNIKAYYKKPKMNKVSKVKTVKKGK